MRGAQRSDDPVEHGIRPKKDIIVPEPQHPVAAAAEELGPPIVVRGLFEMLAAIQFDDQMVLQADEVDQVGSDLVLPTEFPAKQTATAKMLPKLQFRFGLIPSQCSLPGVALLAAHGVCPWSPVSVWRTD